MPVRTWLLADRDTDTAIESLGLGPENAPGLGDGWAITKRRLRGGLAEGVDAVEIAHDGLRFTVLPTRGMGIWRAWRGETMFGWRSPVAGPVHPCFTPVAEPSGLGWLDGFDELFVRCGLTSNGAPDFDPASGKLLYPLHGRIANLPAFRVELTIDGERREIRLTGMVDEARFLFHHLRLTTTISTRIGESRIDIVDKVENLGGREAESQLLYHINFGAPLLEKNARLFAPTELVVPRNAHAAQDAPTWDKYLEPTAGYSEQVYFHRLRAGAGDETRALLANASGDLGASVVYNSRELPYFIQWKNTAAVEDGYVTGLEPAANLPNPRSFEQRHGRTLKLPAGASRSFHLALEFHHSTVEVEEARVKVAALAGEVAPKVQPAPLAEWCS
jgi:hypothetical protein